MEPKIDDDGRLVVASESIKDGRSIEYNLFPIVKTKRRVFFELLSESDAEELASRGYDPVVLMSLPRETERDHQNYLFALLQGMTEGTVPFNKQRLDAAELELKARKMFLADYAPVGEATAPTDIEAVWNWEPSRHTIQGNTTIVTPENVDAAARKRQNNWDRKKKGAK